MASDFLTSLTAEEGQGPHTPAADAPVFVHHREITLHLDHVDRADLHTESAPVASLLIRLPEEVGGHQDIPGNLLSPDRSH